MKKKKIVWLFPHFKFWMGGTKFVYEVCSRLAKKYDVKIFVNQADSQIAERFRKANCDIISFSFFSTNSIFYWAFLPISFLIDFFIIILIIGKFDFLIATSFPSNLLAAIISKIKKKKYIYYCYEPFLFFHSKEYINSNGLLKRNLLKLLSFFYSPLDVWATKQADIVFTLNNITKDEIKKVYKVNAIPTFMGVDTKIFKHYLNNPLKKKYQGKIIITHSTDYSEMKRTDLAILAIKKLIKNYPNILLLITSTQPDSPSKKKYEKMVVDLGVEKNVSFLGLVPIKDLPLYYSVSLCYLSCSYDRSLGTTSSNLPVKEAMACETPCIRAPITTEDVEDGISGFLVDPKDTKKVVEKIKFLINNPKKRIIMGKKAREKIVKYYNWKSVVNVIKNYLN